MKSCWVVCALVVCGVVGTSSTQNQFCPDLKPQKSLDLDELMGMWYAVEIVQHHYAPHKNAASQHMDVCPTIHLTLSSYDHVRLLWNENAGVVEYNFKVPVRNNQGFWLATGNQNGSLTDKRTYVQFSGTAQVMKAVGNHMVLTLCSRPEQQVMSVLLAREMSLEMTDIISVNKMLERRGLQLSHIRETCRNAAILSTAVNFLLLAATTLFSCAALLRW